MVYKTRAIGRVLSIAAVLGSGVLIAGCGGSSSGGSASTGSSGAGSKTLNSLVRAADLSAQTAGYKVDMVMVETVAGQSINLDATGSYAPKLRQLSMSMDMDLPTLVGGTQQFRLVLDNGTFYMKFPQALAGQIPGGKPWVSLNLSDFSKVSKMPGFGSLLNSASSLNDPGQYLDFLHAAADGSVTNLGPETIAGVQTTHYEAQLQFSKLADAMPAADRSSYQQLFGALAQKLSVPDFPADVWIDQAGLVRRIMLNMKMTTAGHEVDAQITENFSDYGPQPAPTLPAAGETTDLMSMIGTGG